MRIALPSPPARCVRCHSLPGLAAPPIAPLRTLYPPTEAHHAGSFAIDGHEVHFECRGNPRGAPVLVLHGGPGAACWPRHTQFFDPNRWRVVLMDQRGCGSSKPRGRLAGNDTWRLVSDIEVLRRQVGVRQWGAVMGGSWGSTLALAYASQHPDRVAGLVLRGVCLMRRIEMEWFFGGGAGQLRPKEFAAFTGHVARGDNSGDELLSRVTATDVLRAYLADLTATDGARRAQAAGRWAAWEHAVGSLRGRAVDGAEGGAQAWWVVREAELAAGQAGWGAWGAGWGAGGAGWDRLGAGGTGWDGWGDEDISLAAGALRDFPGDPGLSHGQAQALLTAWYSLHLGFGAAEGVGAGLPSMRGVPCIAVQGAEDHVCPLFTAQDIQSQWPEMDLRIVRNGGHSMYDPPITDALLHATDDLARVLA